MQVETTEKLDRLGWLLEMSQSLTNTLLILLFMVSPMNLGVSPCQTSIMEFFFGK